MDEDPGWPFTWSFLLSFIPFVGLVLFRRRAQPLRGEALGLLRLTFLSFCMSAVMFALVLLFIPDLPNGPVMPWLPILLGVAAIAIAIPTAITQPLDCVSDTKLAGSYRTRFFLRTAFGESVALLAFVFTFIGAPRWTYDVGAVVTLAYWWMQVAPTQQSLLRDQDALQAQGCDRSLVRVLRLGEAGTKNS
jgi:F0F1-type ATP synthase membrane subunit c/vacuolar-type H+-ATPase subunit K